MVAPLADPLASIVLEGTAGPVRVLDIATGHGLFGVAVAKQNPQGRNCGIGLGARPCRRQGECRESGSRRNIGKHCPAARLKSSSAGPYGIALLTNFLHHFDRSTCVALLRKVGAALPARRPCRRAGIRAE